jgi:hypothetical protein
VFQHFKNRHPRCLGRLAPGYLTDTEDSCVQLLRRNEPLSIKRLSSPLVSLHKVTRSIDNNFEQSRAVLANRCPSLRRNEALVDKEWDV